MGDSAESRRDAAGKPSAHARGSVEVLSAFLRLGLTSFGGPIAHLGYFREAFVQRRRWLTEADFADLVAVSHVLPGPSSSQVAMAIGLQRAGLRGMLAAWVAFTLPSALLMIGFAYGASMFAFGASALIGLKAVAVAVVAHAVMGMTRSLSTGPRWLLLAAFALVAALVFPGALTQVIVIALMGVAGLWFLPQPTALSEPSAFSVRVPESLGVVALAVFTVLLFGLPIAANASGDGLVGLADGFYRTGALVFGGGHVVLPLLEAQMVHSGPVSADDFLAGYGVAQALPGPLFAFAAYLGFLAFEPAGLLGASVAIVAIFVPSMLLLVGVLPFWEHLRESATLRRGLSGVNAGVVGLLGAALVNPVSVQGLTSVGAVVIATLAFAALQWRRLPVWLVVVTAALASLLLA